jgi:hypothetical protein
MKKIFISVIILFTVNLSAQEKPDTTILKQQQVQIIQAYEVFSAQLKDIKSQLYDGEKQKDFIISKINELAVKESEIRKELEKQRRNK